MANVSPPSVSQAQVLSAVRWVISVAGGYALGHGWINNQQLVDVGAVAVALVPLVWSMFVHAPTTDALSDPPKAPGA